MQLDISVLDKHRQPVRGLTQKDFTILDNGKVRPIVGFSTFDAAAEAPPPIDWMRDVAPDVTTNQRAPEARLFVLVMDDALIPQDSFAIQSSKTVAMSIIDKLGPNDLTAMVFTGDNRKTQDFTSDKAKLRAALDRFNAGLSGYRFGLDTYGIDADLWFYQSSIRTLDALAEHLGSVDGQRKTVFWVSPGVPMDLGGAMPTDKDGCPAALPWDAKTGTCGGVWADKSPRDQIICLTGPGTCGLGRPLGVYGAKSPPTAAADLKTQIEDAFRRAQRANLTIYPIDPNGLDGSRTFLFAKLGPQNQGFAAHKATMQLDFLTMTAANTGGRAIVNTNDFESGIAGAFTENAFYYLIAIEPASPADDGRLHRIQVKVDRPEVEVRTRSGYYAPQPDASGANTRKKGPSPESAALAKSMAGILPLAGMPMKAAVAPFAVPGQRLSTVAIVLGITQPIPTAAAKGRVTETTDLLTSAFTPEGDPRGAQRHTARVVLRAGSNGDAAYEVLARIDLPAGRYQLRLAAHNSSSNRDGSLFVDVTVPDYSNLLCSAAPVVLGATPGRVAAPKDLFTPLLPFVPTAEREFTNAERVTALLRLYQGGQRPPQGARVRVGVRDSKDQDRVTETWLVGTDRFVALTQQQGDSTSARTAQLPSWVLRPEDLKAPPKDAFVNLSLRAADVKFEVPVGRLDPGPYLLTFEASCGESIVRRDVKFSVRRP